MRLREVLNGIRQIHIPLKGYPVEKTVASELRAWLGRKVAIHSADFFSLEPGPGVFSVAVANERLKKSLSKKGIRPAADREWVFLSLDGEYGILLVASKPQFLYTGFCWVRENLQDTDVEELRQWLKELSFSCEKSTFDLFLTQYGRLIRNFDPETYIREYARLGFTHLEVNALAFPHPAEQSVPGEFYSEFFTYCPALDQFVSSRLNKGLYPEPYLKANLKRLKQYAHLALRYGLVPGLLCFEPRAVPDSFFHRYPTLRGARVDHPFRSFKPRYSLALAHPVVKKHYEELISNLLAEVPELGFLSIWSNDSGAGFEHTKSLYVGRNGGAYLIREWKEDEEIARAASGNILSFFSLLRDAASRINPGFRVMTRLESFYGEREYLWEGLCDRIDVEVNSLLVSGWEENYSHPAYPEVKVLGSAFHNHLKEEEGQPMKELLSRKSFCFFYHSFGSHTNQEPLLGIPFPWLTYEKLCSAFRLGARHLAHVGGIQPPDRVPYPVNQEVFRMFQFDPELDIDKAALAVASCYAGKEQARDLVRGWRLIESAIRSFPPLSIYTHYGAVWQRLLVRPLVPDIGRIPEKHREYYERWMCASWHNPNKVDLASDVLFELLSEDYAHRSFRRIDRNVWKPLESAIKLFKLKMAETLKDEKSQSYRVFEDQYFRSRALHSLFETLRNTAAWVYAVHTYLKARSSAVKARCLRLLKEIKKREIRNSRELIKLWKEAPVEWMIVSGSEETPFIYGENFPELLEKKISLMEEYGDSEPFIDPHYRFRVMNNPYD